MKLFWIGCFSLFYNYILCQQPITLNKTLIEGNLVNISKTLIQIETKLNKRMSTYGLQLMYCASNLKASKLPVEFTDLLESFMTSVKTVQHLQNHQVLDISNISMTLFDYIQTRTMTIENEIRNYEFVQEQLQSIGINIQTFMRNVSRHYIKNFRTLVKIRSKNRLMLSTIQESRRISTEISAKIWLLKFRSNYLNKLNVYFTQLINNRIIVPSAAAINSTLDPFITKLKETEEKLIPHEEAIRNAAINVLAKIAIAEKSVQKSVSSVMNASDIMKSLKIKAKGISEVNDLPKTTWPRFPDISDNQQMIKLRSNLANGKEQKYKKTSKQASRNQTLVKTDRMALNVTILSSIKGTKKVQSISQSTADVINATIALEICYDNCLAGLKVALGDIEQIKQVFVPTTATTVTTQRYPVTIGNTTTPKVTTSTLAPTTSTSTSTTTEAPTTSTTSTSTTTEAPTTTTSTSTTTLPTTSTTASPYSSCGNFVPFDSTNGLDGPSTNGFSAGITYNQRHAYVGYVSGAHCGDVTIPGLITDDPAKPGGFHGCGQNKYYSMANTFYLLNHPQLRWVPSNSTHVYTIPNLVQLIGRSMFFFPRLIENNITYIGKGYKNFDTAAFFINATNESFQFKTFEVLVCDIPAPSTIIMPLEVTKLVMHPAIYTTLPPPCGTFIPYDPVGDPNAPERLGISAGKYVDGSEAYVGYGTTTNMCTNPCPGRITTKTPAGLYSAGIFASFDNQNAFFLLNHPNLATKPSNLTDMFKISNAIKIQTMNDIYTMFATISLGSGYVTVSKISMANNNFMGAWYQDPVTGFEIKMTTNYNVWYCAATSVSPTIPVPITTTPLPPTPVTSAPNASIPCGTFVKYDIINDPTAPERLGFSAGKFIDGSEAYVGHGNNGDGCPAFPAPGRISTKAPTGLFTSCFRTPYVIYDRNDAFFLLNHPKLTWKWTNSTDMLTVPNPIKITASYNLDYYIGSIKISSPDFWTVGKIDFNIQYAGIWYTSTNSMESHTKTDFRILYCQN